MLEHQFHFKSVEEPPGFFQKSQTLIKELAGAMEFKPNHYTVQLSKLKSDLLKTFPKDLITQEPGLLASFYLIITGG